MPLKNLKEDVLKQTMRGSSSSNVWSDPALKLIDEVVNMDMDNVSTGHPHSIVHE